MIFLEEKNKIESIIEEIFFYGLTNEYPTKIIEEIFLKSNICKELENSDTTFLDNDNIENIIKKSFNLKTEPKIVEHFEPSTLWASEIYLYLFLNIKKSFSFLFLYLPLEIALQKFKVYHEMDFSKMEEFFVYLTSQKKLLPKLIEDRKLTTRKLNIISGININTLNSYCKSDLNLFGGSFKNLFSLSKILNVNENIFLENIRLETNEIFDLKNNKIKQNFKNLLMVSNFYSKLLYDTFTYNDKYNFIKGKKYNVFNYETTKNISYKEIEKKLNKYFSFLKIKKQKNILIIKGKIKDEKINSNKFENIFLIHENKIKNLKNNKEKFLSPILEQNCDLQSNKYLNNN